MLSLSINFPAKFQYHVHLILNRTIISILNDGQ